MGYYTSYSLSIDVSNVNPKDLSKITKCQSCYAYVSDGNFCSNCGTKILRISSNDDSLEEHIIKKFIGDYEEAEYALEYDGETRSASKWYNYKDNLKEFSKKYPDAIFCLHGKGEENGDIWNLYAKNGKVQLEKAQIVIAPYDPNKLQ